MKIPGVYPVVTGQTFFDVPTAIHFAFWFFAGSGVYYLRLNRWWSMLGCLVVAYAWEVVERQLEKALPNVFQHPENFLNGWVSDPLMCVFGLLAVWYALDHWTF